MSDDVKTQRWVSEYGGPLLLLANNLLHYWEGSSVPSAGRIVEARFRWAGSDMPATDYDRACDVDDYLGLVEVGKGKGIVLGGEPLLTTWYSEPGSKRAGTLIRWMYASDEAPVLRALHQALSINDGWQPEDFTFSVDQQPLCLFAATLAGKELEANDCLVIELDLGTYTVATILYKPDTNTSVLLHHLTLNA